MEGVLHDIENVLVYINNLLVHTDTHEKNLKVLDQVLVRLHKNHLGTSIMCIWKQGSFLPYFLLWFYTHT